MAKYVKTEDGFQEIETINLNKMDKNNPVGNGSFSMGRKPGSKIGYCSHAEGEDTTASGYYSHAEGRCTIANSDYQHVQGKNNVEDSSGVYAHIVGNGSTNVNTNRSNAHALDWEGNAYYAGTVYVNGTNADASGGQEVATKQDVTSIQTNITSLQTDVNTLNQIVSFDKITLTDIETGVKYDIQIKNGTLVTSFSDTNLADFTYTTNDAGTYTLTGWNGTLNGKPSTEIVVPDISMVML